MASCRVVQPGVRWRCAAWCGRVWRVTLCCVMRDVVRRVVLLVRRVMAWRGMALCGVKCSVARFCVVYGIACCRVALCGVVSGVLCLALHS